MSGYDHLATTIHDLVMCHSPSGFEQEVDALLIERFAAIGHTATLDACGNLIVYIPGSGSGTLAITAHKDEIGAVVTRIEEDGRIRLDNLGGAFPWIYGEGPVDLLADGGCLCGILSFGSRHVSHGSPQFAQKKEEAPLRWADSWVETNLTREALTAAGVRPGTRVVVGRHRKAPMRMGDHIASYTLDNKASLAIILELARQLKQPVPDVYLVASTKEEIGAVGALYFSQHMPVDAMIALEIAPIAPEYDIVDGVAPVLVSHDNFGHYDEGLNERISQSASDRGIELQRAVLKGFGSDASLCAAHGHLARTACLGFPTRNTHGYEIAHLGALENIVQILEAVCHDPVDSTSAAAVKS